MLVIGIAGVEHEKSVFDRGTMGAGKTTTCRILEQKLNHSVFLDDILSRLETDNKIHTISLMCGERALRDRLQKDVSVGVREEEVLQRSVTRLPLYRVLDTEKIDVSEIGPEEAADLIRSTNQKGEPQHG